MTENNLSLTERQLIKCFDRPSIRIRIPRLEINHGKFPLIKNWPTHYEPLTINQILAKGYNWGMRTGKKIGSYYFIIIDLDDLWAKTRLPVARYIQTGKGIHVYCLISEPVPYLILTNENKQRIGEIHSLNRQVVGIGSLHYQSGKKYTLNLKGKNNSPWFLKFATLSQLATFLQEKGIFFK